MYGERDELSFPGVDRERLDGRDEVRGAAAGVVCGLGTYFAVRHLAAVGGGPTSVALYYVPFLLLSVALLYAGYWLLRSDLDHRRVARVALWSLAGFAALVAVGVWLSGGRAVDVDGAARLAVNVGTVGASSGLLAGLYGERRRQLDRDAAVAVERAEERFAFFDRLLRHHLLNGIAVVRGHAELLTEEQADSPEVIEIIRRRSDEIVHLVRNVEALSRTYTGDLPVYPVDPAPPLRAAIESTRAGGATLDVRGDVGGRRRVLANDRLQVVFELLLEEAAATGDRRASVRSTDRSGEFVAEVAFDGTLVEAPDATVEVGEHGDGALGLFIAGTLVEYFGGSLEVAVAGSRSVLSVRLPLAD